MLNMTLIYDFLAIMSDPLVYSFVGLVTVVMLLPSINPKRFRL